MGTWGHRIFENDTAMDFVMTVEEEGKSLILEKINKVADTPEDAYYEDDDCDEALAAIEYIAAARGKASVDFPEVAEDWLNSGKGKDLVKESSSSGLITNCLKAIQKIKTNSDLKSRWDEGDEPGKWYQALADLENRLK
jgi:hypothetical protein